MNRRNLLKALFATTAATSIGVKAQTTIVDRDRLKDLLFPADDAVWQGTQPTPKPPYQGADFWKPINKSVAQQMAEQASLTREMERYRVLRGVT